MGARAGWFERACLAWRRVRDRQSVDCRVDIVGFGKRRGGVGVQIAGDAAATMR